MPSWHYVDLFFVVLVGLSTGSFVTALAYRLPRGLPYSTDAQGRPIRSICPPCGRVLKPRELVPVLSWLWQKGRCACGRKEIPIRYPIIEICTTIYTYLLYRFHGVDLVDIPLYIVLPYAVAFLVIAIERGVWNKPIFISLIGYTAMTLLAQQVFEAKHLLADGIMILTYLGLLWWLQLTKWLSWGRARDFKIAASALFLLWLLFFPVL